MKLRKKKFKIRKREDFFLDRLRKLERQNGKLVEAYAILVSDALTKKDYDTVQYASAAQSLVQLANNMVWRSAFTHENQGKR